MKIYILTYKRPEVKTLKYISSIRQPDTILVVQEGDHSLDGKYPEYERLVLPDHIRDVAATRQYIVDHASQQDQLKIIQLDDDLTIGVLKEAGAYNLRDADHLDMEDVFNRVDSLLNTYAHVGATARNEAHLAFDKQTREAGRAIRFHGIRPDTFLGLGININRVPTIEDYDFILQLLRTGTPNVIDCQTYVGDGGSNAEGGCSETRAAAGDGHYARLLQSYHPEFVKLVQKETKIKGGETWTRTDVQVQWKKAYESGIANRAGGDLL